MIMSNVSFCRCMTCKPKIDKRSVKANNMKKTNINRCVLMEIQIPQSKYVTAPEAGTSVNMKFGQLLWSQI